SISRILTATIIIAQIRAAERDGAAAVTLAAVEAAGPVAEAAGRAAAVVVEAVAVANVLPRARAPMARKSLSGFLKKPVDVSLKFLKKNRLAISTPALSRNYEPSTAWVIHPTKTAPPPVIITSSWP